MFNNKLQWLFVDGGPLIVIPEVLAQCWNPDVDYARTYGFDGWIEKLRVGDGDALVVGTESCGAGLWQGAETCLIEWAYAPTESELVRHFEEELQRDKFENSALFHHPGGRVLLMSAADVVSAPAYDIIPFDLPRGNYQMRTKCVVTPLVSYVAHRFTVPRNDS